MAAIDWVIVDGEPRPQYRLTCIVILSTIAFSGQDKMLMPRGSDGVRRTKA